MSSEAPISTARRQVDAAPPAAVELIDRISWLIRLRWLAVVGVVATVELSRQVFPVRLALTQLYAVVAAIAGYNLVLTWLARRLRPFHAGSELRLSGIVAQILTPRALRGMERESEAARAALFVALQIGLDLGALALLVHFAGGLENPFIFFFIFHTVISSIILSRRATYLQATLAFLLLSLVGIGECVGILRHYPLNGVWRPEAHADPLLVGAQLLVLGITLFLAAYMGSTIAAHMREGERQGALLAAEVARKAGLLGEAYERLAEIEKVKSQYMRKVSHELRGPLGTIETALKVVLAGTVGEFPATAQDLLARAARRAGELAEMIDELRILSRAREARLAAEMSRFDVNELAAEVVEELREAAGGGGLELTLQSPGEAVTICADVAGVRQVVRNLVSNAIRYSPAGGRVEVILARSVDSLRIEVRDTGIGIPPGDLPHVFEEFYRAPNARARTSGGTGLGLAIVKAVVQQHGGTVEVESQPGRGTRLVVTFPTRVQDSLDH